MRSLIPQTLRFIYQKHELRALHRVVLTTEGQTFLTSPGVLLHDDTFTVSIDTTFDVAEHELVAYLIGSFGWDEENDSFTCYINVVPMVGLVAVSEFPHAPQVENFMVG